MSYNEPGPHGQPQQGQPYGQQPDPYGQVPQQPGRPPQPPQGHPQQNPPGVSPPPGGYIPPRPPGGGRNKKGIIIAAAVALVAIGGTVFAFSGGSDSGSGGLSPGIKDSAKSYILTTPPTLLDSEFASRGPNSGGGGEKNFEGTVKNGTFVSRAYEAETDVPNPDGGTFTKTIQMIGSYGQIDNPEGAVEAYFAHQLVYDSVEDPAVPVDADLEEGAVMMCQESMGRSGSSYKMIPVWNCAIADSSTIIRVSHHHPKDERNTKQAAIQAVMDVREEVRKPK